MEVKRMSAKQYKDACSLIRGLCCNYDRSTGGCLLLDNGEVVQCPQILTQALVCRYFRDVLLEDRDGKALKDSIFGTGKIGTTRILRKVWKACSTGAGNSKTATKKAQCNAMRNYKTVAAQGLQNRKSANE